jgi:peptidoglycan/LPS O-acetylase OafA/YrhL
LRAVAVVAVIVYHCFPSVLPGGFIGVDVFFVVSGFLITSLLLRTPPSPSGLRRFWVRRARRILPALALLLLVCTAVAGVIGGDALVGIGWQLGGGGTFSYNWASIARDASYFAATNPELFKNLWSLAIEEQFYLLWPLLLLLLLAIPKSRARVAIVVGLALASAAGMALAWQPGADPTRAYFGTDTHSFGLFIGAALALCRRHRPIPVVVRHRLLHRTVTGSIALTALTALLVAAFVLHADDQATYRGGLLGICLIVAVLIAAITRDPAVGAILDVRPLRYVGTRSYGLYLWHWPILVLLTAAIGGRPVDAAGSIMFGGLVVLITFGCAALSYRWVEHPIRTLGFRGYIRTFGTTLRRGTIPRRIAVALAPLLGVALILGTASAVQSAPHATTAQLAIERGRAAVTPTPTRPSTSPATTSPSAPVASPAPPPTTASPEERSAVPSGGDISAIGDSVMLASAPELQAAFPGISIDAVVSRQTTQAPAIVQAMADAGTLRPYVVIGLGTNGDCRDDYFQQIINIAGPTRHVIFINIAGPMDWTATVNGRLQRIQTENPGVRIADWAGTITDHADLLASDGIHPGPSGAALYTDALLTALTNSITQ